MDDTGNKGILVKCGLLCGLASWGIAYEMMPSLKTVLALKYYKCAGTLQHCKGKQVLPYYAARPAGLVGGQSFKMALLKEGDFPHSIEFLSRPACPRGMRWPKWWGVSSSQSSHVMEPYTRLGRTWTDHAKAHGHNQMLGKIATQEHKVTVKCMKSPPCRRSTSGESYGALKNIKKPLMPSLLCINANCHGHQCKL
eukprot:1156769-Pelagomonas_calceolata.AAC.3